MGENFFSLKRKTFCPLKSSSFTHQRQHAYLQWRMKLVEFQGKNKRPTLIAKNSLFISTGHLVHTSHLVCVNSLQLHTKVSPASFIFMKWQLHSASDSAQSLVAVLSTLFSHYQCTFHLQMLHIRCAKCLELFCFSLCPLPLTRTGHHHLLPGLFPLVLTISNLFSTEKTGEMLLRIYINYITPLP